MSIGFRCSRPTEQGDIQSPSKRPGLRPVMDGEVIQQQWLSQFEALEDPRGLQGQEHAFLSIVLIAILATLGGATGWKDIEVYAKSHQQWLESILELKHGIIARRYLQTGV